MNIIKKRYIFLGISTVILVASIVALLFLGLKTGIDLKGGTQWQFSLGIDVNEKDLASLMKNVLQEDVSVKRANDGSYIVRMKSISLEEKQKYEAALTAAYGSSIDKNFSNIGPSVGSELRRKSIIAIVFVLFGISLYVAFAFRKVSRPVSSWKYGIITLFTLFHDVIIPAGMMSVLGAVKGVEIDTNFIVALLVVMGFSVHDTIVVFDRIRENLLLSRGKNVSLGEVINKSINETFIRSINTSLTLVITLVALIIWGPPSIFYFILTILVGTIFGTYSSIFVASPLLYIWEHWGKKNS